MPRFGLRAINMAAPATLPTTAFPHSEPAVSAQTAKTSTCCASIRGAPSRRFSATPNSAKRGEPIVNHLRSFLEAAAVKPASDSELPQFTLGMHLKDGVAKRLEWKALEAEISRAEAVTAQTKSGLSPRARQRYLLDLRRSVANAIYALLRDERCEDEDMRSYVTDILIWADPQNARKAIAKEAVTEYVHKLRSKPETRYRYPIIILATEKAGFQIDQEPTVAACMGDSSNMKGDHIHFLEAWREAVTGEAEVLTVVGDSAATMRESLEAVLEGSDHHWVSTPTLIVMYASYDSAITANISSIRRLCDANGIRLCLEGPGLAFLAQAARPSDPNECLQHADVLLTNPGSWFGFEECAFTSIHSTHTSSSHGKPDYTHGPKVTTITSSIQLEDQRQRKAVAFVTKLWTVISQIGVPRIREKVDAVTHIAEALIYHLRDCQSLTTSYEGVGCVVRLSYELSTSERGFSKIEEAEVLSAINGSLYKFVSTEAKELQVFLVVVDNISMLQFSPLRLLNSQTFWVPGDDQIRKFSDALRHRAEFYRLCRTGALVFMERVALCSDIELLEDDEVTEDVLHWYGAFRIVPNEWQGTWGKSSSGRHTVTALTKMFVAKLSDSFASIVMCSPSLKQLLQSCSVDGHEKSTLLSGYSVGRQKALSPLQYFFRGRSTANDTSLDQNIVDLPFSFYIHYDDATFRAPFVSVEPKGAYPVNRAYRHACTAAEIIVAVLQLVLRTYRSKGTVESPNDDFVSSSTEREEAPVQSSLDVKSESGQEDDPSKPGESSLEESEISLTEVDGDEDDDGFVSASNTIRMKTPVIHEVNQGLHHREDANLHCDRDKHLNSKAKDSEIGRLRNSNESQGDEITNKVVSTIRPLPNSPSATHNQVAQGVESRIPWLEFVTSEHMGSEADSEGSDGEYSEDEDCSLTEEDRSLSEDGSDYQDTDSSSQASEDESSENERSESSSDEGYSDSEESEGDSDTGSSTSDTESDHENSILEEIRDSSTEVKPASELIKDDVTRSAWLPSWFRVRGVRGPAPGTAERTDKSSPARHDAERNSSRRKTSYRKASSSSKYVRASYSSSQTSGSNSATSSETNQSSSTEVSDVSSSRRHGQRDNRRRGSRRESSTTSKASGRWGWWKQKPSGNSDLEEASGSYEVRSSRRHDDDIDASSSSDNGSAFPDAFSAPSSEFSSTGSQEADSENGSETNESSSSDSNPSSNSSNIERVIRSNSRARSLANTEQPRKRYWFPYFGHYGLMSL